MTVPSLLSALGPASSGAGQDAPLSPAQKKFNGLVRRIEAQRKLAADWDAAIPAYQRKRAGDLQPLLDRWRAQHIARVHFLDEAYAWKGLGKSDRQALGEIIGDLALQLMPADPSGDMQAVYNRYSDTDIETEARQASQAMKAMAEERFGFDMGADADDLSPEELLQRVQDQIDAAQARAEEEREQRRRSRKKTVRQTKQEEDERQAGQSVREIYRRLASALHPDRETDPVERIRKTELMQRVNQAYAGNRLLDMLQLQLEVDQTDPARIAALGENRLGQYNKLLAQQLAELEQANAGTEMGYRQELGIDPQARLTPTNLAGHVAQRARQVEYDLQALLQERRSLVDAPTLRRWLRQHRQWSREAAFPDVDD